MAEPAFYFVGHHFNRRVNEQKDFMSKVKELIEELKKSEKQTVVLSKEEYIVLLEELKKLRFKCSRKKNR